MVFYYIQIVNLTKVKSLVNKCINSINAHYTEKKILCI